MASGDLKLQCIRNCHDFYTLSQKNKTPYSVCTHVDNFMKY